MIKGGGGALTREKIVAAASRKFVCIVDGSKLVDVLGAFPLPIEVIPMARSYVARELVRLGGQPELRAGLHHRQRQRHPRRARPEDRRPGQARDRRINQIAGVVTVGLFARRGADVILVGRDAGVRTLAPGSTCGGRAQRGAAASNIRMNDLAVPGAGSVADVAAYMAGVGAAARAAARELARADTAAKDAALHAMAAAIRRDEAKLLAANAEDVAAAKAAGQDAAFVDRLTLTPGTIAAMAEGLEQIAALPDPVGEITDLRFRPSGIQVGRMRVPLGVVGIIYESRPNVTADAAGLCLKSGNATILRGGSEALRSNRAIAACVREGLRAAGLPENAVQVVATTDRAAVGHLIADEKHVDVIVPRGGKGLIERISREAKVPVIKHLDGVCHVYVDARRRRRHGGAHRRQREDAALQPLQHDGDAARPRRHRGARAAAARRRSTRPRASSCAAASARARWCRR